MIREWNLGRLDDLYADVTRRYTNKERNSQSVRRCTTQKVASVIFISAALMGSQFCIFSSISNDCKSKFFMPKEALIRSAEMPPPLANFLENRFERHSWSREQEDNLLENIRTNSQKVRSISGEELRLNVLEANQRENLTEKPHFTRDQIRKFIGSKRRLG